MEYDYEKGTGYFCDDYEHAGTWYEIEIQVDLVGDKVTWVHIYNLDQDETVEDVVGWHNILEWWDWSSDFHGYDTNGEFVEAIDETYF